MFARLREDIACVFERDPAARNTFDVLTTYPGIHAMIFHRLANKFWHFGLAWPARIISMMSRWLTGIEIHPAAKIGRRFFIDHGMGVVIGETAEIGDDCTLYHAVTLGGTSWEKGKRHPTLKDNVVVGAGAKVLGPITLGMGARIGSNAVVVKDVPDGGTVVGVPGRLSTPEKKNEKRDAFAKKIGFDAYGGSQDMPDPVAKAINTLLDHIHAMDERVEKLNKAVNKLGIETDTSPLPDLDTYSLDSTEINQEKGKSP